MNAVPQKTDWRDRTDPWYDEMVDMWEYTHQVYTGKYFDPDNIKKFLPKRAQGESKESYDDRVKNVDPEMLFPMLIGSLAGQIHAIEPEMVRVSQPEGVEGLGLWQDAATPAGKMWRNADGDGLNYPVHWRTFTTKLMYYMTMWVYVDGKKIVEDEKGKRVEKEPSIHFIDPQKVPRFGTKNGRKTWVMVSHKEMEGGEEPDSDQKIVEKRTIYHLDGWKRYRKEKDENGRDEWTDDFAGDQLAEGSYEFYETKEKKRKTLPIFCVQIPMDQYLAYLLAVKSMRLMGKESERDHLVRYASLITKVDESSPAVYEEHKMQQREGEYTHNYDPGSKLYFASPPMDPAKENREIIKEKRENFFRVAYQQLNDQAAQVTATQIRQQSRGGVEAYLSLVSTTLDEAENKALFLREQIEFPGKPDMWGHAMAQRSTDFLPADPDEKDKMLREMYFSADAIPATENMLLDAAKELHERRFGELDEEETELLRTEVRSFLDARGGVTRRLGIGGDGAATGEPVFEEL